MSEFRVPFISDSDIELEVYRLLGQYLQKNGETLTAPVDIEDILENHLGLTLDICDLTKKTGQSNILGATWIDEKLVRVEESLEANEGRFCFTLAHEIGHWRLHMPLIVVEKEMPTLFDFKGFGSPPNIVCREPNPGQNKPRMEIQADRFAAFLLMPAELVKNAFAELFPNGLRLPVEYLDGKDAPGRREWFDALAKKMVNEKNFSNCSIQAMRYRMERMNLVDESGQATLF